MSKSGNDEQKVKGSDQTKKDNNEGGQLNEKERLISQNIKMKTQIYELSQQL